jgi:hypothetical protein
VRGISAQSQNFTNEGSNMVTDHKTGLTWQQDEPGQMTWGAALSYCESHSQGGYSDWRLPNIKELESIAVYNVYNPTISVGFFPNTSSAFYWSSTTDAYYHYAAWGVEFNTGHVLHNTKDSNYYTRCVRGGVNTCPTTPISINGLPPYYTAIDEAYATTGDTQVIELQALHFIVNDLDLSKVTSVSLKGGYDCSFVSNTGFAAIHGSVTISGGTVTLENISIQ